MQDLGHSTWHITLWVTWTRWIMSVAFLTALLREIVWKSRGLHLHNQGFDRWQLQRLVACITPDSHAQEASIWLYEIVICGTNKIRPTFQKPIYDWFVILWSCFSWVTRRSQLQLGIEVQDVCFLWSCIDQNSTTKMPDRNHELMCLALSRGETSHFWVVYELL